MSDVRVFNLKNRMILKRRELDKKEIQNLVEANALELLGVNIIDSDIKLTNRPNEILETIGYDEDYRLTLIEYRSGKFGNTINKGLVFLDYICKNKGKIKSYLSEKLDYETLQNIIFSPRLICIGDDFNQYDEYAIKQLPYDIDLIKYKMLDENILVLEKDYQTYIDDEMEFYIDNQEIYKKIDEFVLSLGDEIAKTNINNCVSYRRIKNFMYVIEEDYVLKIVLKQKDCYKKYDVKSKSDLNKIADLIEKTYDAG